MTTNSDQMKHIYHNKWCPNSHNNIECIPLWQHCRHVFSRAKGHKDAKWHPVIDCSKNTASIVAVRQWLLQALEKE